MNDYVHVPQKTSNIEEKDKQDKNKDESDSEKNQNHQEKEENEDLEDYKECSICLEKIITGKRLHCGHINHLKCLK